MQEPSNPRRYVMVLAVAARCVGPNAFKIESAFAQHLRTFKQRLGDMAQRLVLVAPELGPAADADTTLTTIDRDEGIEFVPAFPAFIGRLQFARRLPAILKVLRREVAQADTVHAGPSHPYAMFEFPAIVMAHRLGKHTVFINDMDDRRSSAMLYRTGAWSLRQYLTAKCLWEPCIHLQHVYAARRCSLVLLKGARMAADYGRGRPQVKNFIDAAFEEAHLIDPALLEQKIARCTQGPLQVVYFGRLVAYKGVDHMLRAVKSAVAAGVDLRFEIIGDGPRRESLTALANELGLQDNVSFAGAVSFGDPLFNKLRGAHVLLAAPLSEDTPRSAFDALASGQAIVAYDTYYYQELHDAGAPVTLVPWLDHAAMGRALGDLARDRASLASSMRAARAHAVPNTQEAWLDRRVAWTRELASTS